jgi:hypothetical protein
MFLAIKLRTFPSPCTVQEADLTLTMLLEMACVFYSLHRKANTPKFQNFTLFLLSLHDVYCIFLYEHITCNINHALLALNVLKS